jgi:hypothetical protein
MQAITTLTFFLTFFAFVRLTTRGQHRRQQEAAVLGISRSAVVSHLEGQAAAIGASRRWDQRRAAC